MSAVAPLARVAFEIMGQPIRITEQQHKFGGYKRNGQAIVYRGAGLKTARNDLLIEMMPYKPKEPFEGPLVLEVDWFFGTKDKRKIADHWKITRPDTDNMIKGLKDCLTEAGFWKDDAQVVLEHLRKAWVPIDQARTSIVITPAKEYFG